MTESIKGEKVTSEITFNDFTNYKKKNLKMESFDCSFTATFEIDKKYYDNLKKIFTGERRAT